MEPTSITSERADTKRRVLKLVNSGQGNTPDIATQAAPGEKWVNLGRLNLFPEFVTALVHNYQPVLSAIDTMSLYLAGEGLEFLDAKGEPIQAAADKWAELMSVQGEGHFLRSVFKDLCLLGHRSWEVAYNGLQVPAALYHLDATRLRCSVKDETTGLVPSYWWSSNWELYGSTKKAQFKPVEMPAWGSTGNGPKVKQVSFARLYVPGQDYYGFPWWIGALTDMEVGARIGHFNRTQLDTGFRPAFHIHVFTDRDTVDLEQLDADVEAVWTGVDGKTYVVTHGTVAEGAPQLTKLERGDHAGELDKMGDRAELIAYKAVGVPPVLMGIDVNTGMSGKGLAIEQTLTMFERMQCWPRQSVVTDDAKRTLEECGIKGIAVARVKPVRPFDQATDPVLKRQTYIASTTVNEDRIANGKLPFAPGDKRGDMLLCDALKGAGNLDPAVPSA